MRDVDFQDVVVVGAGEAGARLALELRVQGFPGRVTLVGEERHAPYERPPLSKALIAAADAPNPPTIVDAARLGELGIAQIKGVAAVSIERSERRIRLADGRRLAFDRLVLATGARARKLTLPGAERSLTLRTFEDSLAIRARLGSAVRVVIVGGGFIGLELASGARLLGCEVVVLEADARLLRRSTPEALASAIAARHQREGVEIALGVQIEAIEPLGSGARVILAEGRAIDADVVITGIGAAPTTELASDAGLDIDNGVAVNGALQTSDPDICALGDCCSFPHPLFGGKRIRLEAWRNAQDQADFLARSLMGELGAYEAVPWFWSDQFDLHLQIAGLPSEGSWVVRRDLGDGSVLDFHLTGEGRVVGASALGAIDKIGRDARIAEKLIALRATPDPAFLARPGSKLKSLLSA